MRILFNAFGCGLGNNGGSKTIIRSAETLVGLGHEPIILSRVNKYTWDTIGVPVIPMLQGKQFDAVVCVSAWDVEHVISLPIKNKIWWVRGWERWIHGEDWLITQFKRFAKFGKLICNSSWLVARLKEEGIEARLCWAGIDLDRWENAEKNRVKVGGLLNDQHKTKRSDLVREVADVRMSNNHNESELKWIYKQCSIWFAPTELEGFHNVPAEANLCGCLIVCNRLDSNGMGDYADDSTAMRYDTLEETVECIEHPDYSKVAKMQYVLIEKIGDRKKNMRKFIETLEA